MESKRVWGVAVVCAAAFGLLLLAPAARADFAFCGAGSGAGQCKEPSGIAADLETGNVFISDTGNNRVAVFSSAGEFLRAFGWDVIPAGQPGDTGTGLEVCTAATSCKAGSAGAGEGQLSAPRAIAVDNDGTSPAQHDLYVFDGANQRVLRFHPSGEFVVAFGAPGTGEGQFDSAENPIAIGPGGVVHVGGRGAANRSRVQMFESTGIFIKQVLLVKDECDEGKAPNLVPFDRPIRGLAVDSSGDFYIYTASGPGGVRKYDASGNLLTPCPLTHESFNVNAIAVDPGDNLFVADNTPFGVAGNETAIYQYDSTGTPLHTSYGNGTLKSRPLSLAPFAGELFLIEGSSPRRAARIAPEPPGPVILPFETRAQPVGNVNATFRAQVNPEGKATTVHFEYVDEATYQEDVATLGAGHGFDHAESTPPQELPGAPDFKAHEASFAIACPDPEGELGEEGKCLEAETEYHLRAVATNADGGPIIGPEASFETLPPIQLGPAWSTAVGAESATLHAELNPTGIAATAFFEYVDEAAYLEDLGEGGDGFAAAIKAPDVDGGDPPLDFGAGSVALSRSVTLFPLAPGTTYRYRYVASDFFGAFIGPERAFTTLPPNAAAKTCANEALRAGVAANLPDCRAYELVSPLDKGNGDIEAPFESVFTALGNTRGRVNQATPGGGALAYSAIRSFGDAVSSPFVSQYVARRGGAGWATHSLNPPIEGPSLYNGSAAFIESMFKGFSEDLCSAWLAQNTDLALAPGAPTGVPNLYRRENCGEEGFETVTNVAPPGFGKESEGNNSRYYPGIQGFSADGSVTAFKAPAALTPEASTVPVGEKLSCQAVTEEKDTDFKWLRNGTAIVGATKAQYTTVAADAGKAIQCQALANKVIEVANPAQVVAPFPATAPPLAPEVILAPTTSAPLTVGGGGGQTLSCDGRESAWGGSPTAFAYQWYRNGVSIAGATASTYVTTAPNLAAAATFQCAVSGENAGGRVSKASAVLETEDPAPVSGPSPDPRVLDIYRAYLNSGGDLHLLSVLPNGNAAHTHASVGTAQDLPNRRMFDSVAGAVSGDGSRVFWSAEVEEPPKRAHGGGGSAGAPLVGIGPSRLYLRLNAGEEQSAVEEVEAGKHRCSEPAKACTIPISTGVAIFGAADPAASKALFSEGGSLFELDVEAAAAYEAGAVTQIAGEVDGLLGASEDLSRVYFVSGEALSGEANGEGQVAEAGEPNLYLREAGGGVVFVARLDGFGDALAWAAKPADRSVRVSGDGEHAVFMSRAPLTGYDNVDANSGKADAEVFLYDAAEGELRCVSCNPSGARPEGRQIGGGGGGSGETPPFWAAARIPGWETQWHPSRVLSEDGSRVFFESFEALVSRDTNARQDVYQWARVNGEGEAGKDECLKEIGGERFVPSSGGCLNLISSGKSAKDAEFVDASESGSDVFFATASSLVPQDPGLIDIYDAREGGGFPVPAPPKPPCEGEACQSPPAAPDDPTPASSTFEGEGNAAQEGPAKRRCPKGKRKARRGGKTRCVPKAKKRQARQQRGRAGR